MPEYKGYTIKVRLGDGRGVVLSQVYKNGRLLTLPTGDDFFAELTANEALGRARRWVDTQVDRAPNAAAETHTEWLEKRVISLMDNWSAASRALERAMAIARHWRGVAAKQAFEIVLLKEQHESGYQEFRKLLERLQVVREQRDALIGLGAGLGIRECSECAMPALLVSPAGAYCLSCRREIAAVDLVEKLS